VELIDSKKQKLSYNQVLLGSIINLKSSGQIPEDITMQQAAAMILKEIESKNVQTVQIGNSIFIGVFTPEKNNMYIRLHNMDVGRNVIDSMYRYVAFLQKRGIAFASARITNEKLLPGLRILKKKLEEKDTKLQVVELENRDGHAMFIKLGKEPLMKAA
tara:strand:+ start:2617 stop:3093 length:477 start_codon:yes stop_codon:yes gene_type:complete